MRISKTKATSTILSATALALLGAGQTFAADYETVPEVISTVWMEDSKECASVSINGEDVVTYKGGEGAEQKAYELSSNLHDLLRNKNFKADELLPSAEGKAALVKVGEKTVLKFDPPVKDKDSGSNPIEPCFKLVNALRAATGQQALPNSFLSIANAFTGGDSFKDSKSKSIFSGKASWYGRKFHGRRAANGERYDMHKLTAAHKKLPFGTKLLVKNRRTGKSCIVRVTDRGPYHGNRVIDLSKGAAKKLNMLSQGVAMVDVIVLGM